MTTLDARADAPTRTATLRTLAGIEARRYARHPLFLIGVALLVWVTFLVTRDLINDTGEATAAAAVGWNIAPAFFLGVLGVFVGHRLTRSMARSSDAVEASPSDRVTRTAALCLACLVPGAVAAAWVGWMFVALALWPVPDSAATSSADSAAMLLVGVVYAVGGPLLGVLVGRWTRFPGAALVTVIVLYAWAVLSAFGLAMSASRLANLTHLSSPFAGWMSAETADHSDAWFAGGSPLWYLVYVTLLCGVAATAAMLHEARGPQRSRLVRVWTTLVVLALVSLGLAAAADPTRIPL